MEKVKKKKNQINQNNIFFSSHIFMKNNYANVAKQKSVGLQTSKDNAYLMR